jgi:cell division transport system ATP-binding protein
MIRFIQVHKVYANGYPALTNVNFDLQKGQMVFLTGHSGAGKTSLLKLILCMEKPSRGKILLQGKDLTQLSPRHIPELRRRMGAIFQNPLLLQNRTVFDNVALPLYINHSPPAEMKRRVRAALEKVGLLSKEKMLPLCLSQGEQQRVSIARAVVSRPEILLADEPTGNLDANLSFEIMRLFEAFHQIGTTVIIATHDFATIAKFKHPIMHLKQGQLIETLL